MKDAKGHGSDSRGGSSGSGFTLEKARAALRQPPDIPYPGGDREAATALSSGGPKSDPAPVHDSMMASAVRGGPGLAAQAAAEKIDYAHNPLGLSRSEVNADGIPNINRPNAWGQYPKQAAAARKEQRQFNSAKREINRLRRQGK
jgi:hypothetical protein